MKKSRVLPSQSFRVVGLGEAPEFVGSDQDAGTDSPRLELFVRYQVIKGAGTHRQQRSRMLSAHEDSLLKRNNRTGGLLAKHFKFIVHSGAPG